MTIARVFAAVGMPSPRHLCELEQVVGGADHRPLASDLFEELTEPSDARDLAEDWFRELLPEAVLFSKYLETRIRAGVSHDARCRRYTPRVTAVGARPHAQLPPPARTALRSCALWSDAQSVFVLVATMLPQGASSLATKVQTAECAGGRESTFANLAMRRSMGASRLYALCGDYGAPARSSE